MSERISPIASGVARLAVIIIRAAWALWDHRAEGLTELVRYRAGQRRHSLAAADVSGERQTPPAVALGALPRAALVEEAGDQDRLDGEHAGSDQHRDLVCLHRVRGR